MSIRPNFLGIGAPKCGTTWLANLLSVHPEVFMADAKELLYFSDRNHLGERWYLNHFATAAGKKAIGEFSVNYMHQSQLPASRILAFDPDIKMIAVLRDPVRRAFSHYRWLQQMGKLERTLSFVEAANTHEDILGYSFYHRNLRAFLDNFDRQNLHVTMYEDIEARPEQVQRDVFRFLSVNDSFETRFTKKVVGKTITPRSQVLERLRIKIYAAARRHGHQSLIAFVKRTGFSQLYRKINDKGSNKKILPRGAYEVIAERFVGDVDDLRRTLNIPCDNWLSQNITTGGQR